MTIKKYSLRSRLLTTATLVLFIFLSLMGLVLDRAFKGSTQQAVAERLLIQIYGLLSVTELNEVQLILPEALQEPRFNHPGSGLYGLVFDEAGGEIWQSPSSIDLTFDASELVTLTQALQPGIERFGRVSSARGEAYFFTSYRVLWQVSSEIQTPYTFVVVETMVSYRNQITEFRSNLWGWLLGMMFILILLQAIVMNWGLAPLKQVAADLKSIEDGEREMLDGDYPAEIEGVTRNLNLLLATERQQGEKYRTTLADLAHSLKTPLAILGGLSREVPLKKEIDEQIARMDQIVAYQLERAVVRSSAIIKNAIAVSPVVHKLIDAMKKVYADKQIDISVVVGEEEFFGDERDLMELLGNLVDNACKYGDGQVQISVSRDSADQNLMFEIEDNGTGIPLEKREGVLSRGMRLDSQEAGQGIGLAVVVEIVARYNGTIKIKDAALGGTQISVSFPT
jgi:two-component system sensor histidine kinase PhoQ